MTNPPVVPLKAVQTARGRHGIVAAGHPLATEEAIRVLKDGGNAVDAAVAAGLVLTVVAPYAVTLAGDTYFLIRDPKSGKVHGLNGTGRAPSGATAERFAGGMARDGILSASIPGLLAGFQDALERHGSRDMGHLIRTAIRIAEDGFAIFPYFSAQTRARAELVGRDGEASRLFLPGGEPIAPGTLFRQPELAAVLRKIATDGVKTFYEGEVAEQMVAAGKPLGSLWTADDLAAHRSGWQEPMRAPFYGHDVFTMPPNSYGPTLLLQLLYLQAGAIHKIDPDGEEFIRRGYAARKVAYKTAGKFIADPGLTEAPMRELLAKVIAETAKYGGRDPNGAFITEGAMPAEAKDRCTTNVVVVDKDGLAVSMIESISAPYGAGVVLPGTGILLNNRMAGFNVDAASANCVAPGKRPAHTLAPCMVTKDDELVMSVGTPGTVGQTCVLAQFLARVLGCGQDIAAAAEAPRWSADFQGKLVIEDCTPEALRDAVQAAEPETKVMRTGWISFGSLKLAMVTDDGFIGMADHRRAASTAGY
jgi:gamma-glutamyltranspeptidase/glutathione hydrolase